eukprot:GGOE01002697.1.p1 GENE.GGOE01002697.1~~GGOE01002697.1.p1  ORF type:complete len:332 (+),score=111.84 GGOE01002697.1:100-1095(+)
MVARESVCNFLLMVLNIICVVGLVGVLKLLFSSGFHYSCTLVTLHFFSCGVVSKLYHICWPPTTTHQVTLENILTIAILKVASVSFHNLSLLFNTMTLFEVLSFLTIPVMCSVEYLRLGKVYSLRTYCALSTILLGSAVATVTEVDFSWVGLLNGLLCTFSTALYQLYNSQLQAAHNVDALQLLMYEAPFTTSAALITSFTFGELQGLLNHQVTGYLILLILLSIVLAIGVNISAYLILGKTSAVTYQVVGHMKTFCVLCLGYVVFHSPFTLANALGTGLSVIGVVAYSHAKLSAAAPSRQEMQPAGLGGADELTEFGRHANGLRLDKGRP